MRKKYREKWSREETILAFDLYCRMPFSKNSPNNKEIIDLASVLGRTPGAVSLKLANLAHFDPERIAQSKLGMANASKLDKEVFDEFSSDWENLSYQAQLILAKMKNTRLEVLVPSLDMEIIPHGEDRLQETKRRVGQYFFRTSVLNAYRGRCCVTGIQLPELLIASHIKPWRDSDEKTERANPRNGLCLNAMHDKAFDRGLITIDKEYRMVNSRVIKEIEMDKQTRTWLLAYEGKQILLPDKFPPDKQFIEYHNDVIFKRF